MGQSKIDIRSALLGACLAWICLGCNSTSIPEQSSKRVPVSNSADESTSATESTSADEATQPETDLPEGDVATFGAGCFWCVEAVFLRLRGVNAVESGYAGGDVLNPTYEQICTGQTGHAEVCRIIYDSSQITFDELLEVFWKTHDPTTLNSQGPDHGTQYRSVVFYHDEEQKELAEQYKRKLDETGAWSDPIVTEISPLTNYYRAEESHQNYFARKPRRGYCRAIVRPKVEKFEQAFKDKLKDRSQFPTSAPDAEPSFFAVTTAKIERGELSVLFRDNSESPGILSGIQSLFNTRYAPEFDAYDPNSRGDSAGLNFEHIISAHRNPNNKFTPRKGRYVLYRVRDGNSVRLVRRREDSPWSVSSTMEYTVREPYYVDFEFRCTPHDAQLFGERGSAIFFFANYMNDVAEVPLQFRGIAKPGENEQWIQGDGPQSHPHWRGGGTYRNTQAEAVEYDDDLEFRLNSWSYDSPRYTKPFYYGKAANDMAFILMFDKAHRPEDEIRFSIFKFKLDRGPRPAWDFQYVVHKVEQGKTYGFKGRLAWKKFVSAEDCLREYETWAAGLRDE